MLKNKKFISNVVKNAMAFGIYMAGLHLIMLPYLAKNLETAVNARLLTYIMVSNIITLSLGNELGVLYQVLLGRQPDGRYTPDIKVLFRRTNLAVVVLTAVILSIIRFSWVQVIILTFVTLLTNARLFYLAYMRMHDDYKGITVANLLYVLGVILAIILYKFIPLYFWLPLLIANVLSVTYMFFACSKFRNVIPKITPSYKENREEAMNLSFSALLTNIPNYSDKLLILPLLGDLTMSAYYAGTAFSKILYLMVNPINGVLLVWLSKDTKTDEQTVLKKQLKISVICILILGLLSFPIIYIMSRIFYSQFLSIIKTILLPLSISAAFSISASLLRVVFLRYFDLKKLKYINLIHIASFLIFATVGALLFNLKGFSYGVAISKFVLWALFAWSLWTRVKQMDERSVSEIN